jgi:coenzyme F420-0:L-glutamate ligase/coenzyme F420-1:gamma-L-glutamate ligase
VSGPLDASLRVWPLAGLPEIGAGDDLAGLIADSLRLGPGLLDGDVLVVTSKVVSKALGLRAPVGVGRCDLVVSESVRIVAERDTSTGPTRIVEAHSGVVAAAAGVDASNTGPSGEVLLLPRDPDAVTEGLHGELAGYFPGVSFAVILSDTAGRPWRGGQVDFALGACGLRVIDDHRGGRDADGRALEVTAIAVADELAATGDLVKGKAKKVPVALIRGAGEWVLPADEADAASRWRDGARRLVRTGPGDWFAMGHVEAVRAALGHPPGSASSYAVGIPSVNRETTAARMARAIRLALARPGTAPAGEPGAAGEPGEPGAAGTAGTAGTRRAGTSEPGAAYVEVVVEDDGGCCAEVPVADEFAAGYLAARLEVALMSEGLAASVKRTPTGLRVRT